MLVIPSQQRSIISSMKFIPLEKKNDFCDTFKKLKSIFIVHMLILQEQTKYFFV